MNYWNAARALSSKLRQGTSAIHYLGTIHALEALQEQLRSSALARDITLCESEEMIFLLKLFQSVKHDIENIHSFIELLVRKEKKGSNYEVRDQEGGR